MHSSELILSHLEALYYAVTSAVTTGNAAAWGKLGQNAKGDQVKWFDLAADQAVCHYLEQHFPSPVVLLSEEGEPRSFGRGEPEWTMVLDPVDGSENFLRGHAPAGTAIALIPAGLPVAVDTVEFALVGSLYRSQVWRAARGQGATRDGQPMRPSSISQLATAMVNFDVTGPYIQPALARVLAQTKSARSFGATTITLANVADGSLEAHVDIRNQLTPENFLAPGLIIREAGGVVTGAQGESLPPVQSLTDCYSLIAAANPELHALLLQQLADAA